MDHNAYAVAMEDITASNQVFTATYRLYIGDADGNPVARYGNTTTTWTWLGPLVTAASIQGTTLSSVPMQGSMLMPVVAYHASKGTVTVNLSGVGVTAQLTPLLVSHPTNRFDPADPWFDSLDPSRQGLAFSRRYGFIMDTNTDMLPDNRKNSGFAKFPVRRNCPSTATPSRLRKPGRSSSVRRA